MRLIESCNPSAERVARALATVAATALAFAAVSCAMTELTAVQGHRFPKPDSCAHCHVEIYDEWSRSPHARAFTNPRFHQATDGHRFGDCIGCHAPQPALVTAEPVARDADRHLGVVCVSCHLDKGAMVGPLPPTGMAKPHPITVDPAPFVNGKLCGHCHQGEMRQWELAAIDDDKPDCRVCHMPAVDRKMTQATSLVSRAFVATEDSSVEHRHLFLLIPTELPAAPFTLDVKVYDRQATVTLTNKLPHNLPTGDFGVRVIEVRADAIRDTVAPETLAQWELTNFGREPLTSGQSRRWSLALPEGLRALRLHVTRHGRDPAEGTVLLRKEVPLP